MTVIKMGLVARKPVFGGFRQSEFQTSLLSYSNYLESWNFTCSKFTYDNFQKANNNGADQTARMRRLVCACVVRKPPKTGFLALWPKWYMMQNMNIKEVLDDVIFLVINYSILRLSAAFGSLNN